MILTGVVTGVAGTATAGTTTIKLVDSTKNFLMPNDEILVAGDTHFNVTRLLDEAVAAPINATDFAHSAIAGQVSTDSYEIGSTRYLIDSTRDFLTEGVTGGDYILNVNTGGIALVTTSFTTSIYHAAITGGTVAYHLPDDNYIILNHFTWDVAYGYERVLKHKTESTQFDSGFERHQSLWSKTYYEFRVPLHPVSDSDADDLESFFNDHKGRAIPFIFTCPKTSTLYRVHFMQDECRRRQVLPGHSAFELKMFGYALL